MSNNTPVHSSTASSPAQPQNDQAPGKTGPFAFLKRLSQSSLTSSPSSGPTPQRKSSRDETMSSLSPNPNAAEHPVPVSDISPSPVELSYTAWINAVIHVRVDRLFSLRDGTVLLKLISTVFPSTTVPAGSDLTDGSRVNAVLTVLRDQLHVTAPLPVADDIVRGDTGAIESLLRVILRSLAQVSLNQRDPHVADSTTGATVHSVTGESFDDHLLSFINNTMAPLKRSIKSFHANEWSDGIALCAVITRLCPSATIDLSMIVNDSPSSNISTAIRNGQRELSIMAPFNASELSSGAVSDELIELYVTMLLSSADSKLVASVVLQHAVLDHRSEVAEDLVATNENQFDRVAAMHDNLEAMANSDEFEKPPRAITAPEQPSADPQIQLNNEPIEHNQQLMSPQAQPLSPTASTSTSTSSALEATKFAAADNAPQGGREDTDGSVYEVTSSSSDKIDSTERDILRFALISAHNENKRLLQLLDQSSTGLTVDSGSYITPSRHHPNSLDLAALQRIPLKGQKELTQFINDLPSKRGWLMQQSGSPPEYSKRHATLLLDCLYLADDALTPVQRADRIILTDYFPIQRGADSDSDVSKLTSSITGTKTGLAQVEEATVVGGRSLFFNDRGAYVLHLLPRDSTATHIILTGADEKATGTPDDMLEWVESINIRLCLLDLIQTADASTLLSNGGHEILSFLCELQSNSLRIQNKPTDMVACFAYFKEGLMHRYVPYTMTLSNIGMTDDAVKLLCEILMINRSVYHIDLSYNAITDVGASYLASALEMNSAIMSINLDGNRVRSSGLSELFAVASTSQSLQSLSLQSNHISGKEMHSALATFTSKPSNSNQSKHQSALKKLVISRNDLGDAISSQIARIYSSTHVLEFGLSDTGITDTTVEALCSSIIAYPRPLHLLDLSYNKITRSSFAALSTALLACPSAVTIDLSGIESVDLSQGITALLASGVGLTMNKLRLQKISDVKADNPSKSFKINAHHMKGTNNVHMSSTTTASNANSTYTTGASGNNATIGVNAQHNNESSRSSSNHQSSNSDMSGGSDDVSEKPRPARRLSITKEDVDNATRSEIDLSAADELGTNVDQIAVDAAMDPNATTLTPSLPTIVEHDSGPVVINADATDSTHLAPPPTDVLKKIDTATAGAVTVRPDTEAPSTSS